MMVPEMFTFICLKFIPSRIVIEHIYNEEYVDNSSKTLEPIAITSSQTKLSRDTTATGPKIWWRHMIQQVPILNRSNQEAPHTFATFKILSDRHMNIRQCRGMDHMQEEGITSILLFVQHMLFGLINLFLCCFVLCSVIIKWQSSPLISWLRHNCAGRSDCYYNQNASQLIFDLPVVKY